MTDRNKHPLHRAFAELRESDERAVPDFDRMLSHRAARSNRAVRRPVLFAMMCTAALVVVFTMRDKRLPIRTVDVAKWRASSDALLEVARPPAFDELTSSGTSSLNDLLPPTLSTGNRR